MAFDRLAGGFAAPAAALAGVAALLGWAAGAPGLWATKLILLLVAAGLVAELWRRTGRTNRLVARFVAALGQDDLSQGFRARPRGAGLDELGRAFDGALGRLRAERRAGAAERSFAAALVDEAPTALLAVDPAGTVHLANKAARRLFREGDGRGADAFGRYGAAFARLLAEAAPGGRHAASIRWNGLSHRAVVTVALAEREGAAWRILSVQPIQAELDAAEMAVQADLVRVLTHEIMNSLTPVASLAETAHGLLDRLDPADADALADARLAVGALSRRAAAVRQFVQSYRTFSETPAVAIRPFAAEPWLDDLLRSFAAMPEAADVAVERRPEAGARLVRGDATLLGQVLLNLLKNAAQATAGRPDPRVAVGVARDEAGRTVLRVSDNGSGIPPGLEAEMFLPFFTTKRDGTGIGLSFARQVVLLHGGAIGPVEPELGGATLQITL